MTKKEQALLHSNKCQVEVVDAQLGMGLEHRYIVSMSLCGSELIALRETLSKQDPNTAAGDVYAFLRNALERAGIT